MFYFIMILSVIFFFAFNIMNQEYFDLGNIIQSKKLENMISFMILENKI